MICNHCGRHNPDGRNTCTVCGKPMTAHLKQHNSTAQSPQGKKTIALSKYCDSCGSRNANNATRCAYCGDSFDTECRAEKQVQSTKIITVNQTYYVCAYCENKSLTPVQKCTNCGRNGPFYKENRPIQKYTPEHEQIEEEEAGRLHIFGIGVLICMVIMLIFAYQPLYYRSNDDRTYTLFEMNEMYIPLMKETAVVANFMLVLGTVMALLGSIGFIRKPELDKKWQMYVMAIGEVLVILAVLWPFVLQFSSAMASIGQGGNTSDMADMLQCNYTSNAYAVLICFFISSLLYRPIAKAIQKKDKN